MQFRRQGDSRLPDIDADANNHIIHSAIFTVPRCFCQNPTEFLPLIENIIHPLNLYRQLIQSFNRLCNGNCCTTSHLLCYAVFLLYPMLNLLRQSVVTTDGAFTLEYFQKFFGKSYYLITLWNSFKVSIAVTIITLIIGVPLAYLYNMYEIKGKGLLQIIIILCSMSAPFIGAYSWILMLGNSGIIRKTIKSMLGITLPSIYGFNGILLVLSLQLFPLVFLYVSGAMKNIDNSLLEAARNAPPPEK